MYVDIPLPVHLGDVREPNEYELANIGGTLIPLGQIASRIEEVPAEGDVVLMCRSGGRSAQATQMLRAAGRENVINLSGGITAWSREIDPAVQTY